MNVETIKMDPNAAAAQLHAYRAELKKRNDAEYRYVAAGLEALSNGHDVLLLSRAFDVCPFDEQGRPRLAIARADREEVRFSWNGGEQAVFDSSAYPWQHREPGDSLRVRVGCQRPASIPGPGRQGFALVPMIPAPVRQQCGRFRARDRFILWEVERWADRSRFARPDRDPLLLRHLGGDIYSVEAHWDLTSLEQAAMLGRALS